ncbi:hypothetical protein [Leifsonia sp. EB34]|uniref:hypothetical protein n=1 Tax=Leifsonia sp. EB34 TaxID=3156303 RepID=UPI003518EA58
MALRDEIDKLFYDAEQSVAASMSLPGVAPGPGSVDPFTRQVNARFVAIRSSLVLLADRIDALEARAGRG